MRVLASTLVCVLMAACGGGGGNAAATSAAATEPAVTVQELQCQQAGWQREVVSAAGLSRLVLWKAPIGAWTAGAIVVMHGGGGQHTNFCVANVALTAPQVRFTEMALQQGYAVFLLDSSDRVTDDAGRLCGKVWDDEVRGRTNLDLPFVDDVLRRLVSSRRPAGSRADLFLTGHSSGGYMAVRVASTTGELLSAFAPVSSGDPYGWYRDCTPRATDRSNVFGAGFDLETDLQIIEPGACAAATSTREKDWSAPAGGARPPWRMFHHAQDGINDRSCVDKVGRQLAARGYPGSAAFTLDGGARSADVHYWLDDYNAPMLAWFASMARR